MEDMKFKTDINNFDIINDKKAEFLLTQAKEVLQCSLNFSNQINSKNSLLLGIYISLLGLILGFKYEAIILFIPIIIGLIISLLFICFNLFPLDFYVLGNEPKNLYTKSVCECGYDMILCGELNLYQERIEVNKANNNKKSKNLTKSIIIFLIAFSINFILFLFYLNN